MADLPAGAHPCATCRRPIWTDEALCWPCQVNPPADPDPQEGP